MVVKFESCVQHFATLMRPVFQFQKQFLVLIILDSTTFDLLKNFFLILIFNIAVFYLLCDGSFSHLYHFHFVDTLQRCFSPPSSHCILWFSSNSNSMAFLLNISQQVKLFSILFLGHFLCYCSFPKGYHLILMSTYFSNFSTLGHLSLRSWVPLPGIMGHPVRPFTIALCCSMYCMLQWISVQVAPQWHHYHLGTCFKGKLSSREVIGLS